MRLKNPVWPDDERIIRMLTTYDKRLGQRIERMVDRHFNPTPKQNHLLDWMFIFCGALTLGALLWITWKLIC